jgi:hypothetical protein
MSSTKQTPDQAARQFYSSLNEGKCHISWNIFSGASQKKFADWSLKDLYERNNEACVAAQLGVKEVKLMFENNDPMLIKFFWRRFFFASSASEIYRLGYFSLENTKGKKAIVKVTLKYPNGQVREIGLPMVSERGGWKLAYVENNLPF